MKREPESGKADEGDPPAPEQEEGQGLVAFFLEYKAWWLVPIVVVVVMLLAMVLLSATQTLPFMYRLVRASPAREDRVIGARGAPDQDVARAARGAGAPPA
ncbi:MAG: DUF5989 family protein [Minicystis sp.]